MFYDENKKLLEAKYPSIYKKIEGFEFEKDKYEVICTKTGLPTVKVNQKHKSVYLHSKYDPVKEAELFIKENVDKEVDQYIAYGLGFAYHIYELLKHTNNEQIYIFESNKHVFKAALEEIDLTKLLNDPNVHIIFEDKIDQFLLKLKQLLHSHNYKLIIHSPSLNIMTEEWTEIKYLFEEFRIQSFTIQRTEMLLKKNFHENVRLYDKNIDVLFNQFNNMPIVIVSAGPSLDKNKHLLRHVKGKAIILSVGRSVKPLISEGIYPDLIIMLDPYDVVYEQLRGLDIDIPIIVLSTCSPRVLKEYKGYKFLALQKGFPEAEEYAEKYGHLLIETGDSVATAALDVAIRFGCNPIIFVGQDLAYTYGRTHAKGTNCKEVRGNKNLREITGINGEKVYTTKSLAVYLRWIENRIKQEKDITFLNATEGGARIEGTTAMALKDVIEIVLDDKKYNFYSIIEEEIKNGCVE